LMDRRQHAWHASVQKTAGRGNDEERIRRDRNSSAEIAATSGPLQMGRSREVQQPGEHAGVFRAMTRVIVLRSESLPKREAKVDRGRNRSLLFGATWNDQSRRKYRISRRDLPWNRCC